MAEASVGVGLKRAGENAGQEHGGPTEADKAEEIAAVRGAATGGW
jgi:hypothetical protein